MARIHPRRSRRVPTSANRILAREYEPASDSVWDKLMALFQTNLSDPWEMLMEIFVPECERDPYSVINNIRWSASAGNVIQTNNIYQVTAGSGLTTTSATVNYGHTYGTGTATTITFPTSGTYTVGTTSGTTYTVTAQAGDTLKVSM